MKIYTRTGDAGETGRLRGDRVNKSHPQIEACGAVDELNAMLGWASSTGLQESHGAIVRRIQQELFAIGALLAGGENLLNQEAVTRMEADIDRLESTLPPLTQFILPGGGPASAAIHLARTTCRRAERRVVEFAVTDSLDPFALRYLNRLADLLFVLARACCHASGEQELIWDSDSLAPKP